jgi:hypothetical protein
MAGAKVAFRRRNGFDTRLRERVFVMSRMRSVFFSDVGAFIFTRSCILVDRAAASATRIGQCLGQGNL